VTSETELPRLSHGVSGGRHGIETQDSGGWMLKPRRHFAGRKGPHPSAPKEKILFPRPFQVGGTGLEPVTPSLSTRSGRSRQFAQVRPGRIVKRKPLSIEQPKRTGANAKRCHCCHAVSVERAHPSAVRASSSRADSSPPWPRSREDHVPQRGVTGRRTEPGRNRATVALRLVGSAKSSTKGAPRWPRRRGSPLSRSSLILGETT
jgi:hypothetical protein